MYRLFAVSMLVLACGCASTPSPEARARYERDRAEPLIRVNENDGVTFRDRFVDPMTLPVLLKDAGFAKDETIPVHVPETVTNYSMPYCVLRILVTHGYPRAILVKDRHAASSVKDGPDVRSVPDPVHSPLPPAKKEIRYK